MTAQGPMLSIYRNHDRHLLFHGDLDAAKSEGIKLRMKDRVLNFRNKERTIVNHVFYENGDVSFWIAAG